MSTNTRFRASGPLLVGSILLLLSVPALAAGQGVTGQAIDADDGQPITSAQVILLDGAGAVVRTVVTDSTGRFGIPASDPGRYSIRIEHLGYGTVTSRSFELEGPGIVELELRMAPDALALDSLVVHARDEEVALHAPEYDRRLRESRRLGRGRILAREDLVRHGDRSVRQTLELELQRFRNQGIDCTPKIFWNGLAVSSWEIPVSEVEGIEVYRGASEVPQRYTKYRDAVDCGVVLVWSRIQREGEGSTNSAKAFLSGVGAFVLVTLIGL